MPNYSFKCKQGCLFDRYLDVSKRNRKQTCPQHGEVAERDWSNGAPAALGTSSFTMSHSETVELGRTFSSAQEMDAFCKANKLEKVDIDVNERRCNRIVKERDAASLKKFEDGFKKELSQHSHIITENGLTPLGE